MQYTTHYNLYLPEGTDIVNPLVQDNPNYSDIDAAMFANRQAVIGTATEIVSGTVHAITRSNTDSNYFKFTATGNWTAGDSMSVDGVNVSVFLSDGTTPATGAYIINTEVLALLSGTRVTLIVSSGAVDASAVSYDNSGSGLTASNVQDAIDEIAASITPTSISVTGDGVKTYKDVLDELFSLVDITKITANTYIDFHDSAHRIAKVDVWSSALIYFSRSFVNNVGVGSIHTYGLTANASYYRSINLTGSGNTPVDSSAAVVSNGQIVEIVY